MHKLEPTLTTNDLATIFQVTVGTVRRWRALGKIRAIRVGGPRMAFSTQGYRTPARVVLAGSLCAASYTENGQPRYPRTLAAHERIELWIRLTHDSRRRQPHASG